MGVLAATFTSTEPASHISPGSAVCLLCPCQLEAAIFLFSASWPVAERSAESLYVLSNGVEYFGENTSGKTCFIEF